jgi:glycosyltransferase involved in cell wall biosynthesis
MDKRSLSFVIPAYNEEGNIRKIVANAYDFLNKNFENFEIIIVDDGSVDGTQDICHKMISEFNEKLVVLKHLNNRGYGAALRTGMFSSKSDLVFYTDADNQFDVRELSEFIKYINDYDIVIGYRKDRKDAILRKFCAYVYNRLIFLLFALDVKDIDCSFKLFNKKALWQLSIDTDEFLVDTELLVKAKINKLKIKETGVTHFPRIAGKSTVKFKHVLSTLRDVIFLYRKVKLNKS